MQGIRDCPSELVKTPPPLGDDKYHAFISHCTADKDPSITLRDFLESRGFVCFHMFRDYEPGKTIVQDIYDAIKNSKRMILLISNSMIKSDWVEFEIWNGYCKSQERGEVVIIPVLLDIAPDMVPSWIKELGYVMANDDDFWPKLLQKLTTSTPMRDCLPCGNVAHGMVWNYFYGFLALVLPDLENKIAESDLSELEKQQIIKKVVVVIPESCVFPRDASEMFLNIEKLEKSIVFKTSRGGKARRTYTLSVYKITDRNGKEHLVPLDFAAPLAALHQMEMGRITNLTSGHRKMQVALFHDKLKEILQKEPCAGKNIPILIKGEREPGQHKSGALAEQLLAKLEQEPV